MAFSNLISAVIFLVSLPPLHLSITSAQFLMRYEEKMEKAAKYSNEADRQLYKTRTTQGAAVIACITSTVSAACLMFLSSRASTGAALAVVNVAACLGARIYVSNFWKGAARVPFANSYNDASRDTDKTIVWLGGLAGTWAGYACYRALLRA